MSWLLSNSLVALVLGAGVLAIGRFVKPAPVVMHVLWLFVLLKLVSPPLFEVPIWTIVGSEPAVVAKTPDLPGVEVVTAGVDAGRRVEQIPTEEVLHTVRARSPWSAVLLGVWFVGSLVFCARLAHGIHRARRRITRLAPAPQWLQREVGYLAQRLGVPTPRLLDDPCAASPCVWSLGTVRLLLPARSLAEATRKGRLSVLAHELAHVRRGDHWVAHLELVLAAVLWWHPLFWFARAQLRNWAELACDAWAVAMVPGAALDYATVLVDSVAAPDSAVPGMTVLAARPAAKAAFERRLTMILNERVACRASRGWLLPFAALGLGLFAVPVAAQRQDPVRVEIKVNGKDVQDLDAATRDALMRQLRQAQDSDSVGKSQGRDVTPKKSKPAVHDDDEHRDLRDFAAAQEALKKAMTEVKAEIAEDSDLRELGLTDDVAKLVEEAVSGADLQKSVQSLLGKAMQGATRIAMQEIRSDPDLCKLGIDGDVEKLVAGLLRGENGDKAIDELLRKIVGKGFANFSTGGKSSHDSHSDAHSDSDSSHQESRSDSNETKSETKRASTGDAKADTKDGAKQKGKKKSDKRKQ